MSWKNPKAGSIVRDGDRDRLGDKSLVSIHLYLLLGLATPAPAVSPSLIGLVAKGRHGEDAARPPSYLCRDYVYTYALFRAYQRKLLSLSLSLFGRISDFEFSSRECSDPTALIDQIQACFQIFFFLIKKGPIKSL